MPTTKWDGIDRRQLRRRVGTDPVTNDDLDEALAIHGEVEKADYTALFNKVMEAFPDGVENHCDYHKSKIEAAKAEKEFWDTAKKEIIKKGIGGLFHLVWIIGGLILIGASVKYGISLPFVNKP